MGSHSSASGRIRGSGGSLKRVGSVGLQKAERLSDQTQYRGTRLYKTDGVGSDGAGSRYRSRTKRYTARGRGRELCGATLERMFVSLPVSLLSRLSGMSGQTVILAELLHREAALAGWPVVKLPVALLNLCRLNRDAVSRALQQLETAGLVRVHRKSGRRSTVTVLWHPIRDVCFEEAQT